MSKENHVKYLTGIEYALRNPGIGYTDPRLSYQLPEEISTAGEWTFNQTQEIKFREEWYKAEFESFLRDFIANKEIQESLLVFIPEF